MQYRISVKGHVKPRLWMLKREGFGFRPKNKDWSKVVGRIDQDMLKRFRDAGFSVTWWKIDGGGRPIPNTRRF